ncbi:hypothetical protein [Carnobacterium maltaromaticum]|uniref:hypothetical protein n=1 Tax=Carnobacterium maltaromaticum TaxID=2751 RepID=UPI0012F89D2C|nr:hypothetical protein [Carnobacterium maltaromaticum]
MNKKIGNYFLFAGILSMLLLFSIDTIHAENNETQSNVTFYGEYVFPENEEQENVSHLNERESGAPLPSGPVKQEPLFGSGKYLPQTGLKQENLSSLAMIFFLVASIIKIKSVKYLKSGDSSYE